MPGVFALNLRHLRRGQIAVPSLGSSVVLDEKRFARVDPSGTYERTHRKGSAVGFDADRAVLVGTVNAYAASFQRRKRRGRGVAEEVVAPDRDDRVARRDGSDERRRRSVSAAVMTDFEHIRMKVHAAREQALLGFRAGIPREDHREATVFEPKYQRIIVDVVTRTDDVRVRRGVKAEGHAVVRTPHVATARFQQRYALRSCDVERVVIGISGIRLSAVGKGGRTERSQYRRDTAGMVS